MAPRIHPAEAAKGVAYREGYSVRGRHAAAYLRAKAAIYERGDSHHQDWAAILLGAAIGIEAGEDADLDRQKGVQVG